MKNVNNHWLSWYEDQPDESLEFNCCMCDRPMADNTSYCSFTCMDADNPVESKMERNEL
jgi:hypothetical protein|tara:strand:- start:539 stop:715 length:177 start_codon:yes stop_codon:yes gene_type:complete